MSGNPLAHRSRNVGVELRYLVATLQSLDRRSSRASRLELSIDGEDVVAQLVADGLAIPLAARGATAPAALRELVDVCEAAIEAAKRRPRRRR